MRLADGDFKRVAETELPNVDKKTEEQLKTLVDKQYSSTDELNKDAVEILGVVPQMCMANGNYVICDKDNYAYTNAGTVICRYKLKEAGNPAAGIELDKQVDMAPYMNNVMSLVGMVMTYDGYLVVASGNGIAIIDREMNMTPVVKFIPDDQIITNSVSVDENNGIYVASNSRGNGAYAIIQYLENGDLLFNSVGGPFRVKL